MAGTVRQASTEISADTVYSVSTSAQNVLPRNSKRRSLSLQNTGTAKLFIRFNKAPVTGGATDYYSFILAPAGGATEPDGGILSIDNFVGHVYAKTASGTTTLAVTEFIG
tara:strand:- start:131 stop:460 length:330 start_codon:yes stop_codon:yes gene_type:complete